MALLKGGKGGGSSTTNISSEPDKAYNARMAKVTERQQALSDQFFNWWQTVQAPVEQANADAQLGLIPAQTDIVREGLEGFKGIQTDFYNASRPTSTETYANMALSKATGSMNRNMSRMGISPTSGAAQSASRDLAIQGAASIAGAANTGRMQGEEMNLKKLSGAMAYGLGG
ncbi:hypothetical protein [Bilophila wadsworthia]|uniref:hypothetical protein n=1 Tax=Bilophila wadsworthia TaxID=35833 RepID=UPI001DDD146E|nr:hypothetical protein [Bilophila wadsworthia]MBS5377658.1 hypothetical protein [Bilophila wadsworthia]